MRKLFVCAIALIMFAPSSRAIPDTFIILGNGDIIIPPVIPATPRFGADLTRQFLGQAAWQDHQLEGPWQDEPSLGNTEVKRMTQNPVLFGAIPERVFAYSENDKLQQISITYLDSGTFFGFKLGGEKSHQDRLAGNKRRSQFSQQFAQIQSNLRSRLEGGCGAGTLKTVGRSNLLRTVYTDFAWEDYVLRLESRPNHSISLHLMHHDTVFTEFSDPQLMKTSPRERLTLLANNVRQNDRGDLVVDSIPMFSQGNTPFCGIHSLAMAGHYYGLRMAPESLIASANYQNTGTARGSNVFDLYSATAQEVGMKTSLSARFDPKRIAKAIETGMPVIIWRRVSLESEKSHADFAKRLANNPELHLAKPTSAQRATWPPRDKKSAPSHASLVTGINLEHGEAIITEPWGEHARGRSIHIEELEATTYAAFYFKF